MATHPRDVLILHGLNGSPGQFADFTKRLETLPEVNRVFLLNLPPGSTQSAANTILNFMQQYHIARPILIGCSKGTTLAAFLYATKPLRFDGRLIFISPWLKIGRRHALTHLKPFFKNHAAFDYPNLLVLYGENDRLVRPKRIRKCLTKLCDCSIIGDDFLRAEQIENGTHTMVLDDPAKQEVIVQEIYRFLNDPAKRSPIDHRHDIHHMEGITS